MSQTADRVRRPDFSPVVSVVVPCKNDADYLPSAIESILRQDYPHIECIVVDGGSTDGTIAVLEKYGNRIRWLSEPDNGAFDAINRGWKLSRGEILAWLNADDLWELGAVQIAVDVFGRQSEVDVVFGTAGVVDEAGRAHGDLVPETWNLESALLHCDHIIFQPASFMRRRIVEKVGWLYPAWCHDHDLWLRIAVAGGNFLKVPDRLAWDRMRSDNLGRLAKIVIPGKIGLTKRFFENPGLPPEIRRLRRPAISNAYLRAVAYLQARDPVHWFWAARLLVHAAFVYPRNAGVIAKRCMQSFRSRGNWLYLSVLRPCGAGVGRAARLIRFPRGIKLLSRPRWWLVKTIEQAVTQGTRELKLELGDVQRRLEATQRTNSEHLQPAIAQIDRLAEDLARTVSRTTQQQDLVADALQALRSEYQLLRQELRLMREAPVIEPSGMLSQVYGTPPTLRRIPGWHTGEEPGPFARGRLDLWSSLQNPVLMRWFADLLVMIWPGNELSRVLFLTGNFEPNELTWLGQTLTGGMTVIDVGAHMGLYSMVAAKLVGDTGVVVAMEPSMREFQRLAFHVMLNNLQNVRCRQVAASDCIGETALKIAWEWNSGHNTFGEFFSSEVEEIRKEVVRTETVDSLVAAEGLQRVDLLKIDVEGHEPKVLMGAAETLRRFRPYVLIEVFEETLRRQGASAEALLAVFESHHYTVRGFSDVSGKLVPFSRTSDDRSRNLVAVPRRE